MGSRWELFQSLWRTKDEESPITDSSNADDSVVEDAINRFQEISKEITDMLVALSAERTASTDRLRDLQECVTMAYVAARNGSLPDVSHELEKVVNQ